MFWLLLLFVSCASCFEVPEFTNNQFDEQVKAKEFTLIMFYAPWCGHCKKLKPSFEAAAITVSNKLHNAALAKVDCTTQTDLCSRFKVSGYPTVKLFKNGEFEHEFDGPRNEGGIVEYMMRRSSPPSVELTSTSQLDEILNSKEASTSPVVVLYLSSQSDPIFTTYKKVAGDLIGKATFIHSHSSEFLGVSADRNHLRLYRPKLLVNKLTAAFVDFADKLEEEPISQFILKKSQGLVGYRDETNQIFFSPEKLVVFYHNFSLENYAKGVNYHRNRLIKLIEDNKLDNLGLVFAYSYAPAFHNELSELGHDFNTYPFVALFADAKKYKLDKYDPDSFIQFIRDFKAGSLEPYLKSEPIPVEQTGALQKVVALNFDSVVNDPNKDVFIMFHAPWCGHCKQLMPKFESTAEKLKDENSVLLVTFDATANDVPSPYDVHSYPTLYFAPKLSKKTPKRYEGAREIEDLIKFIASESSEELKGYDRKGASKHEEL